MWADAPVQVCVLCVDVPVEAMEVSISGLPQWLSILHFETMSPTEPGAL